MKFPWHVTMGIYNEVKKIFKEEADAREKAEKEARSNISVPSMPSFPH